MDWEGSRVSCTALVAILFNVSFLIIKIKKNRVREKWKKENGQGIGERISSLFETKEEVRESIEL